MSKKNRKKAVISDFGVQELEKSSEYNELIRKVDKEVFYIAQTTDGRRLEKVHKSVLENYHARNMLCNYNSEINAKRFWAGNKFEKICYHAGLEQRITARLTDMVVGTKEDFILDNIDAHSYFHSIIKQLDRFWHISWWVMVLNRPANKYKRKGMEDLQEALDRMVVIFDL